MPSVIIPILNGADTLSKTLAAIPVDEGVGPVWSVIVCDGGSVDDTVSIVREGGARVVTSPPGRGQQLAAGAAAAQGEWLLFLHADSVLQPGWQDAAQGFMDDPANERRAGYFRLRFDDDHPKARRLERIVAWRSRALGLPYGDQGLLIHRSLYEAVGGFHPMPLMEDVDLVRRIGRSNLVALNADIVTSADRYRQSGWWRRSARNLCCLMLYFCKVPPRMIATFYGR